jgi:LEA14-like dessication related protein
MSNKNLLLIAAAGLFAYWAYSKYRTVINLQFLPRGISTGPAGFAVQLGVQNTSNQTLQYNSFAGTLSVNGQNVANVSDFQAVPIQANAETELTINITPNIVGLISQIFSQIQSGVTGITSAVLQGTANVGGQQYNVNVQLA